MVYFCMMKSFMECSQCLKIFVWAEEHIYGLDIDTLSYALQYRFGSYSNLKEDPYSVRKNISSYRVATVCSLT